MKTTAEGKRYQFCKGQWRRVWMTREELTITLQSLTSVMMLVLVLTTSDITVFCLALFSLLMGVAGIYIAFRDWKRWGRS